MSCLDGWGGSPWKWRPSWRSRQCCPLCWLSSFSSKIATTSLLPLKPFMLLGLWSWFTSWPLRRPVLVILFSFFGGFFSLKLVFVMLCSSFLQFVFNFVWFFVDWLWGFWFMSMEIERAIWIFSSCIWPCLFPGEICLCENFQWKKIL